MYVLLIEYLKILEEKNRRSSSTHFGISLINGQSQRAYLKYFLGLLQRNVPGSSVAICSSILAENSRIFCVFLPQKCLVFCLRSVSYFPCWSRSVLCFLRMPRSLLFSKQTEKRRIFSRIDNRISYFPNMATIQPLIFCWRMLRSLLLSADAQRCLIISVHTQTSPFPQAPFTQCPSPPATWPTVDRPAAATPPATCPAQSPTSSPADLRDPRSPPPLRRPRTAAPRPQRLPRRHEMPEPIRRRQLLVT